MSQAPLRFRNREELVSALRKHGQNPESEYHVETGESCSLEQVIRWVAPNTFRAFHHCDRRPSLIFRDWARRSLNDEDSLRHLSTVQSQAEFDHWHQDWCNGLESIWLKEAGKPLPWGPSRKLPNLLIKGMLADWRSDPWNNKAAMRVAPYIHVPLDSYSLACIRGELTEVDKKGRVKYLIPAGKTMSWVSNQEIYDRIHEAIREVCQKAGVYPIVFDNLAWDSTH